MKVFLSFLLVCISIPILAQKQPIGCPLDQAVLSPPEEGTNKVGELELKNFIKDQLKLTTIVNRSYMVSSSRFFSIKKENDLAIYTLHFQPADAYHALYGHGASKALSLYLLLHSILHTDLKHGSVGKIQENEVDYRVGVYLAQLGVGWSDLADVLTKHIRDGATRKDTILKGYQTVNLTPIVRVQPSPSAPPISVITPKLEAKFEINPESECKAPCKVTIKNRSEGATIYKWYIDDKLYRPSSNKEFSYPFNSPGIHKIGLIAENAKGQTDSEVKEINVSDPIPNVEAKFEVSPESECEVRCKVTIKNRSEGTTIYKWYIDDKLYRPSSNKEFSYAFNSPGTHKIRLIAENAEGQTDSEEKEINVSNPKKGIVGLWEINGFTTLPLGAYKSSLMYDTNNNRWDPNAGMALLGGGMEVTLGIKAKWLGLGMHLGAMYSPYNTHALDKQLGAYQVNRKELLQNRSFTTTGHRFAIVAGYLSLEPMQGRRFYLAFEPAYGLLLLPFQNEVSVTYQKEDGKVNTTQIFYGNQENLTAYFAGKLSLGIRTGNRNDLQQKKENLIYVSGTYMHADLKIATQSHSFGDNSNPLTISQLLIRGANLGIGYRHTF